MTKSFWKDERGNFAMMTAILAVPVLMAGGLAVDYVNMSRQQHELQLAIDSAALAVTREGPTKITEVQAKEMAEKFIKANYPAMLATVKAKILDSERVQISASFDQPIGFGSFFGMKTAKVGATSTATFAAMNYEIAFVLDTTGSMAGGKLTSLQNAVVGMITDIEANKTANATVKYAVVPYSGFVNVGTQYGPTIDSSGNITKAAASWIDQDARATFQQSDIPEDLSRFALFYKLGQKWGGCVETREAANGVDYSVLDTAPDASKPNTLFTPMFAIDEPDNLWDRIYPNSYLSDQWSQVLPGNKNKNDKVNRMKRYGRTGGWTDPKTLKESLDMVKGWKSVSMDNSNSRYYSNYDLPKGPNFGCDTAPIQPLTSNASAVKTMIKNLAANGSTNTLNGVTWGWRVLSPGEPFTEGASKSDKNTIKTMIFLTDGTNSFGVLSNLLGSGYTSMGYLTDGRLDILTSATNALLGSELDAKTLTACTNIKNDGIDIYTIRLEEPDVQTGTMLKKCASKADNYFDAPSRSQLDGIFKAIKKDVMRVRLSS